MWQQADDACSDCPVNYCEDYKDYRDIQGGYYLDISLHLFSPLLQHNPIIALKHKNTQKVEILTRSAMNTLTESSACSQK